MKLFEIDSWCRENKLEDSWWLAVGNEVQGPMTLAQAGAACRRTPSITCNIINVTLASQDPAPWIPVEIEKEDDSSTINKTTMRMQISKFKTGVIKKPISSLKPKSSMLSVETTS